MKWKITYLYKAGPEATGIFKVDETELEKALRKIIGKDCSTRVVNI